MAWTNTEMADEVIVFFKPHSSVNLGIGMPTKGRRYKKIGTCSGKVTGWPR